MRPATNELTAITQAAGIIKATVSEKTTARTARLAQTGSVIHLAESVTSSDSAMQAIEAEAEISEGSATGFLQLRSGQKHSPDLDGGRQLIISLLNGEGKELKSTLLMSLATQIKKLIQELIERLLQEAANESNQKADQDADEVQRVKEYDMFIQKETDFVKAENLAMDEAKADLDGGRQLIISLLNGKGKESESTLLMSLATQIGTGAPFTKIKKLIQELIERLLQEAANESNQKGWCDKATADAKQKCTYAAGKIEDLNVEMAKLAALSDKLGEEIKKLGEDGPMETLADFQYYFTEEKEAGNQLLTSNSIVKLTDSGTSAA